MRQSDPRGGMRTKALSMLVILTLVVLLPGCSDSTPEREPVLKAHVTGIFNPLQLRGIIDVSDVWVSEDNPEKRPYQDIVLTGATYQKIEAVYTDCDYRIRFWWLEEGQQLPRAAYTPHGACVPDRTMNVRLAILDDGPQGPRLYTVYQ